ncbi:hypothetical protein CO230_04125 [Chryseobacterium sp. 6424]|uniref:hypothetical protein n=1 Tax=Chryseobacterium sp. 6424 TaxID=2039166 RepID=UPI000EFD3B60|nr:hypothetical protein [Chryseobacterium sp. 6424]AYO57380.1 hypothetical protein CO230_04125 [Chryseobacterium sp. 6424]
MKNFLFYLIFIFLISCVYDSSTYKISNYDYAVRGNLFEKGWIPQILINEEMKNIYLKTNVDSNNFFFRFNLPKAYVQQLTQKLKPIKKQNVKLPNNILKLDAKLLKEIKNIPDYFLLVEKNDSVNVALDLKKNIVYGWK